MRFYLLQAAIGSSGHIDFLLLSMGGANISNSTQSCLNYGKPKIVIEIKVEFVVQPLLSSYAQTVQQCVAPTQADGEC